MLNWDVGTVRGMVAVAMLIVLCGCAGQRSHVMIAQGLADPAEIAGRHEILIATTRAPGTEPGEVFSGGRGPALAFAQADISVPAVHETGRIERPRGNASIDPARHFAASEVGVYEDEAAFSAQLRTQLAATDGRAMVFVHGYRTRFDDAVYRMTQIIHDSGYSGTAVLFTWASSGRTVDYVYDNNSATIGRDGLERTLRLIRSAGATRIDIVAHSMGNWTTMEALRQIAIADERDITETLGDVVLASPDIDVDVFRSQLQRIGMPERPFFVLLSRDDRALLVSSIIAGNRPRVGDYDKSEELAELGIIVVNVSGLGAGDPLNHTKFADNPLLVKLLGDRLRENDQLGTGTADVGDRISRLALGLGQTLGTAAEIVITTPIEVISIAVGGAAN